MTDSQKHFEEPIRRQIAGEFMQKELRKLLPSVPAQDFVGIDKDVTNWWDGSASELAPIHDFWNGFEGISQGFKLKKILPYLTAENIKWSEQEIELNKIVFTTNLPVLADVAKEPFLGKVLVDFIANPVNGRKLQELKEDSIKHANSSLPRDNYRIIAVKNTDGNFSLLDGHRRVIKMIIESKNNNIPAYVGEFTTTKFIPENFWISTGFLRTLKLLSEFNENDQLFADAIDRVTDKIVQNHQNAAYIYPLRVGDKRQSKL